MIFLYICFFNCCSRTRMTTARSYRMCFSEHTNQPLQKHLLCLSVLRWFWVFCHHFIPLNIHWILTPAHSLFILTLSRFEIFVSLPFLFSLFCYYYQLLGIWNHATPMENNILDLKENIQRNDNNRSVILSKIIHSIDRCKVNAQRSAVQYTRQFWITITFAIQICEQWTMNIRAHQKLDICINSYRSLCTQSFFSSFIHQSK